MYHSIPYSLYDKSKDSVKPIVGIVVMSTLHKVAEVTRDVLPWPSLRPNNNEHIFFDQVISNQNKF